MSGFRRSAVYVFALLGVGVARRMTVSGFFLISPLLYHQSILDYKYMYVDSRKWQYKT